MDTYQAIVDVVVIVVLLSVLVGLVAFAASGRRH
jgi:hypothetical protein